MFAVILIVVIALVVKDCQRSQLEDKYTTYINGVAQIQTASAEQGARLRQVMANPRGQRPPQLRAAILAISKDAQGLVDQAEDLDPPGALNAPQRSLITALEYRVAGLQTLGDNLPALLQRDDPQTKAAGIAKPMQRFLASDVIYEDSFKGPAMQAAGGRRHHRDRGAPAPALPAERLATRRPTAPSAPCSPPSSARTAAGRRRRRRRQPARHVARVHRGAAVGDAPGAGPGRQPSRPPSCSSGSVTVKNGGDFDETDIVVRASFSYPATPNDVDTRRSRSDESPPARPRASRSRARRRTRSCSASRARCVIEVDAVTGETRTDNNTAEYPVKITI